MISPGSTAPAFDLPISATAGQRVSLREKLARGALLVVFFKTECPTCKLAFPVLERIWKRVRQAHDSVGFVAIAQNHSSEMPAFAARYGATFPIATEDEPYPVADGYEVTNVPSIFLVDENGVVLRAAEGFSRAEYDTISEDLLSRGGVKGAGSLFTNADTALPALQPG